jgi:sec-independent protein translocase protein TatA
MGMIGFQELLIILVIVLVVFGTKKLRNMGGDLGGAIKNFRSAMRDGEEEKQQEAAKLENNKEQGTVIEGKVTHEKDRA